jgi:hypothetical protein
MFHLNTRKLKTNNKKYLIIVLKSVFWFCFEKLFWCDTKLGIVSLVESTFEKYFVFWLLLMVLRKSVYLVLKTEKCLCWKKEFLIHRFIRQTTDDITCLSWKNESCLQLLGIQKVHLKLQGSTAHNSEPLNDWLLVRTCKSFVLHQWRILL